MSSEGNGTVIRRVLEVVFNKGDLGQLDTLIAPSYVDHTAMPGQAPGVEGFRQTVSLIRAAFPDLQNTVEDLIAEGDRVAARWVSRAHHKGEFLGVPPTDKAVTINGIYMYRIVNGQLVERWGQVDMLGLMQQLGAVPAPSQEAAADEVAEVIRDNVPLDPKQD